MQFHRQYRDPRPGEVSKFLSTHATWAKAYGKEIRFRPSPCCNDDNPQNPSAQIHSETGLWRCFKGSCQSVGNFFTLTRAFGDPLPENDRFKDDHNYIPPDFFTRFPQTQRRPVTNGHYPKLLDYCMSRGFSKETLEAFRVSTKGPDLLRFPIYAWNSEAWGIVNARIINVSGSSNAHDWFELKGGPTGIMVGQHLINLKGPKRALITEGQWDAMTAYELGMRNVFSIPNGVGNICVSSMLRYIPDDWEIWLSMDEDAAGQSAVEKFFAQLGPDRVARLRLPYKDLNEWLTQKPNLSEADVVATATGITNMTSFAGSTKEFLDLDMDEGGIEEPEILCETPWQKLNTILAGGFYSGQTTGVLAPSGRGKTTIVNQMGVFAASKGVKVGLISLEGTRHAFKRKIKDAIKGTCEPDKYQDTVKNLMISQLEGSKVSWRECLTEFEKMLNNGARILVLDNLDFITRDRMSEKAIAYAEIIEQARMYNCHTIVVWQPNKVDRNQTVNSGNQKGYSQTFQDSDNYLNLNLYGDFNLLEVEKSREKGVDQNNKVYFLYDKETRCFRETVDEIEDINDHAGKVINLNFQG